MVETKATARIVQEWIWFTGSWTFGVSWNKSLEASRGSLRASLLHTEMSGRLPRAIAVQWFNDFGGFMSPALRETLSCGDESLKRLSNLQPQMFTIMEGSNVWFVAAGKRSSFPQEKHTLKVSEFSEVLEVWLAKPATGRCPFLHVSLAF